MMNANHHIWRVWSDKLHMWGVDGLAAGMLEALGPLTTLGAQMIYLGQPLLRGVTPDGHLNALAQMLENSAQTRAFVEYLREQN